MHSHILSLDKKSWTRSFESRPNLFRVERKHRPNCGLEFHFWFWIFVFSCLCFCPLSRMVPHGADSLCVCLCLVFERWHAKGQWQRPGHISLNTLRPTATARLLSSPNPSNSPCGREQHDSGTPPPRPPSCMHVSFVPFRFFGSFLYFFVKSKDETN